MSTEDTPRRPRSFSVDSGAPDDTAQTTEDPAHAHRNPRAFEPGPSLQMEDEDYFEREGAGEGDAAAVEPEPERGGFSFASLAVAAAALFASMAAGLWIDSIVRALFERNPWLGWTSAGLAALLAAAVVTVAYRETAAMLRLRRVDRLRTDIESALGNGDERELQRATDRLIGHMAANPRSAAGRKVLDEQEGEVLDADDRYRLAERELFRVADRDAFGLVIAAARRVSIVTAVSPRAFLDILYVLYENFRLLRRLSELYGGRAGALGNMRLARKVLGHLAITGVASFGDGLVQQVIGQGMASRLSARLGEGVLNGLMTARVGIAAMEVCRPAPFHAVARPKLSSALSTLTSGADDVKVTSNPGL